MTVGFFPHPNLLLIYTVVGAIGALRMVDTGDAMGMSAGDQSRHSLLLVTVDRIKGFWLVFHGKRISLLEFDSISFEDKFLFRIAS